MKNIENICIIDDDVITQFVSKKIIHNISDGFRISSYMNGEEAIESFKKMLSAQEPLPDVILLDINMPIMDGWQFMDEFIKIKDQIGDKIPIYITSSSLDKADINKAKTYEDIQGFIHKPLDKETLIRITGIAA